jgi:hypothetical protein
VEPEPSSGEASNPINLIYEADENTVPIPENDRRLQNEWQFLHRVIPDVGDLFVPIEEALKKHFNSTNIH